MRVLLMGRAAATRVWVLTWEEGAEDDAILVDDVDLAVGFEVAEDLGGAAFWVVDFV